MILRIIKQPYSDTCFYGCNYTYMVQVQKSFLWIKYWKDVDWSFSLDKAKRNLENYKLANSPDKGEVVYVEYSEEDE